MKVFLLYTCLDFEPASFNMLLYTYSMQSYHFSLSANMQTCWLLKCLCLLGFAAVANTEGCTDLLNAGVNIQALCGLVVR